MISVLILTLNEEANIEDCLASVPADLCNEFIILDSGSKDRTVALAQKAGCKVISREFDNYAGQRNYGLQYPFANNWVLMLDADERVTKELASEIQSVLSAAPESVEIFCVRRKDFFMGKWLRRSSGYPTYFPRLFKKSKVRVSRAVNEEYACEGEIMSLNEHIYHLPFSKGVRWWFERHVRYAAMEAVALSAERKSRKVNFGDFFRNDALKRRAALKQLAYRLPFRPALVFIYLYAIRGGWLDGYAGYCYARMRATYESMIALMTAAHRNGERH